MYFLNIYIASHSKSRQYKYPLEEVKLNHANDLNSETVTCRLNYDGSFFSSASNYTTHLLIGRGREYLQVSRTIVVVAVCLHPFFVSDSVQL